MDRCPVQEFQPIQVVAQHVGEVRIILQELVAIGQLTHLQGREVFFQRLGQARIIGELGHGTRRRVCGKESRLVLAHGTSFKERRKLARARVQSFLTESRVRPIRWETPGKVKPSRCRKINTSR